MGFASPPPLSACLQFKKNVYDDKELLFMLVSPNLGPRMNIAESK